MMSSLSGLSALIKALDRVPEQVSPIGFWWRDDDLDQSSPALLQMLDVLQENGVTPLLATVPGRLHPSAIEATAPYSVRFALHGWMHQSHSTPPAKKSEYGPERPMALRLSEIKDGRLKISVAAGDRALPWFVPPWNRIDEALLPYLPEQGIEVLSAFETLSKPVREVAGLSRLDTHVDLIDWKSGQRPLSSDGICFALADWVERRLEDITQTHKPIGVLSHHLVTANESWQEWTSWVKEISHHPNACWMTPEAALDRVREHALI